MNVIGESIAEPVELLDPAEFRLAHGLIPIPVDPRPYLWWLAFLIAFALIRLMPMETLSFSTDALKLLRRRLADEYVAVSEENKPLYRELVAAGLMYPVSGFTRGLEANFRLTEEGWARRHEFSVAAAPPTESPAGAS